MPLSAMRKTKHGGAPAATSARMDTRPPLAALPALNLIALPVRLYKIWRSRVESDQIRAGTCGAMNKLNSTGSVAIA